MIMFAKGITSGSVPMGGVIVRKGIYDAFMRGPMHVVELFHGYTYSAHPLACAAGLATPHTYPPEPLFQPPGSLDPRGAEAAMGRKGLPNVLAIRGVGLTAGIDLASRPGEVGKRAYDAMDKAFHQENLVIRAAGETIVLTPPLIVSEREIEEMFAKA